MVTQRTIESLGHKLAKLRKSAGRKFSATTEKRLDNLHAKIAALPIGAQLAISMIAFRIGNKENGE